LPRPLVGLAVVALLALAAASSRDDEPAGEIRLIGDWETPDVVLISRETAWAESVEALIGALDGYPVELMTEGVPLPGLAEEVDPSTGPVHESPWVRDFGPLQTSRNGRTRWLDPVYLTDRPGDDSVPRWLGRRYGVPVDLLPVRLEGGAIVSNGRRLCAMTGRNLRATGLTADDLAERVGCATIAVIPALIDEPTGHADLTVHFLGPDLVAVGQIAAGSEPDGVTAANGSRLDVTAAELGRAARVAGLRLEVIRVPVFHDGVRFLSYLNLVDLEDRLLVPDFSAVPTAVQSTAYGILERATGKKIVAIPADILAWAGGGVHCIVLGLHTDGW
jgi:agmatine/peptidylarginine deiminase